MVPAGWAKEALDTLDRVKDEVKGGSYDPAKSKPERRAIERKGLVVSIHGMGGNVGDAVAPFVAGYAAGETPNPCATCNGAFRFDALPPGTAQVKITGEAFLMLAQSIDRGKATYVVVHCNHPRELTASARSTLARIVDAAVVLIGQDVPPLRGLDEARLAAQVTEIHALNAAKKFRSQLFTGTECDILPDGRLDFDDGVLATLDYVVASVHNAFAQDEAVMTARIIRSA